MVKGRIPCCIVCVFHSFKSPAHTFYRLFLASNDITLKRCLEVTRICGHIPRQCFRAALSPESLSFNTTAALNAIRGIDRLANVIIQVHTGNLIHPAFEIYPSSNSRQLETCLTRPVSDWAFSQMMAELDRRGATYEFYQNIQRARKGAVWGGKMFEAKVHKFFESITEPRIFTIHSLDNRSSAFDIEFSRGTTHHTFGASQQFAGKLASSVKNAESCYLRPLSPVFPTFNSFLHQHDISQSGCQPLIGFQITTAHEHSISVKGLADIQKSLKLQVPELNALRPTAVAKWIVLFVVPEPMAASFVKQPFKDAANDVAHWGLQTTQYVLGLPEQELMRS